MKKMYQHPKDFVLKTGEEINDSIIFPIAFIAEEVKESKILIKKLEEYIAKEFNVKTITKFQLVSYFLNQKDNQIDQDKLIQTIKMIIDEMNELDKFKIDNYLRIVNSSKQILQLIMNELITNQLDQEDSTKKVFKQIIKTDIWVDLIYWEETFKVDKTKLELRLKLLSHDSHQKMKSLDISKNLQTNFQQSSEETQEKLLDKTETSFNKESFYLKTAIKDSKISSINIDLLIQALCVYAFNNQNVALSVDEITIVSFYQQRGSSFIQKIKRFLKKDLKPIPFAGSDEVGYGIKYGRKEATNVMYFYGIPSSNFKDKTLVMQILNNEKIQKELWFRGIDNKIKSQLSSESSVEIVL